MPHLKPKCHHERSASMEGKRETHSKVVQMVLPRANEKAAIVVAAS